MHSRGLVDPEKRNLSRRGCATRIGAVLLTTLGACAPDVVQNPAPGPAIVVEFDLAATPPVAPVPNDLALASGKIVVPPAPTDTPAQTEFNETYLGTLTGYPYESTCQVVVSGALDRATVTAENVVVVDVTVALANPTDPLAALVSGVAPTYDAAGRTIELFPPAGGWTRAHRYAVVLFAGPAGLRGARAEPVIGSPTWALVSSPKPLVDCPSGADGQPDLGSAACALAVDVIPSTEQDPAARRRDQTQKAVSLETIRRGYAPLLAQIQKLKNLPDSSTIPILWTFTIVDAGEVTFDPAAGVIPFPNDVLRSNGAVALPNPKTGNPLAASDCALPADPTIQLYCGLNTLDGFSTTAPPVSENGAKTGAVAQSSVDPSSLTTQTVGLVAAQSTAPAAEQTTPAYAPCLNCLSSPDASGAPQISPQQLQWRLDAPLDEQTTYLAYVTGDVKDDRGTNVIASPAFALLRLTHPLFVDGKSQVNVLSDAQAAQLEPLRVALKPAFDGLTLAGLPRANLTLLWGFTTQSEGTALDGLYSYVSSALAQALPQGVVVFADATSKYTAAASAAGISIDAIGTFYVGTFETPVAVTGPGGTLDPATPTPEPVTFALAIPSPAAAPQPPGGYPIAIFGHDLTRDHDDLLGIANALAKAGRATIAIDALFHGERSSCTGSAASLQQTSDDAACADPATMTCNEDPLVGRCVARNDAARIACPGLHVTAGPDPTGNLGCAAAQMGVCASDGRCEGGDFRRDAGGRPVISGWNVFSVTNFFATRDNLRQQVIDLAQLVHTLRIDTGPLSLGARIAGAGGATRLDAGSIGYVGQGLGGIVGTLFGAVSPEATNVVLNTPGGALPDIVLEGTAFASQKQLLVAGLAAQGIQPGTPDFDQFVGLVHWVLDPADPVNLGWRLTHAVALASGGASLGPNRRALLQFIEDDPVVPNASSLALLASAARPLSGAPPGFGCASPLACYEFTGAIDGFDATSAPLAGRHGFLLQPPSATAQSVALTAKAQAQAATFLASGSLP